MFNTIDQSMCIVYLGIKPRPIEIQKMTLISNVVESWNVENFQNYHFSIQMQEESTIDFHNICIKCMN